MVRRESGGTGVTLQAGSWADFEVAREVPSIGYFLRYEDQDVLLHYSQIEGEIEPGDHIRAFLYHDSEDRIAATMKQPLIELGKLSCLEVADIHPRMGYFLEMGLGRQLLLPASELPELPELRPRVGDSVWVRLDHDRQGRMMARLANEKDFEPLVVRAPEAWKNSWVDGIVYKTLKLGTFVICDAGVLGFGVFGFVHSSERTAPLRIGQQVHARVTHVREDGRVNLSLRLAKEAGREDDAGRIFSFLSDRPGGAMPYSDETPPDVIMKKFGLSKSAFKRALGKLMKEGKVTQKGSWTYLKESESPKDEA